MVGLSGKNAERATKIATEVRKYSNSQSQAEAGGAGVGEAKA